MKRTGLFVHPDGLLHDMGHGHPECPERLQAIEAQLQVSRLMTCLRRLLPEPAQVQDLLLAHTPAHIEHLQAIDARLQQEGGLYALDPDTRMNRYSWRAALQAAGAAVQAVDAVLDDELCNAFCMMRPPGHHAEHDRAMGFCLLSNVAIAAKYACERRGLQRVAIVDFDVHHGNGTEDVVAGDERILMLGFYQYPLYPMSSVACDAPNLLNCPVPAGADGRTIRDLVQNLWLPRLREFQPELVIFSAGFDAHADDPLAALQLHEDDYAWLTWQVAQATEPSARGRIVSCLEGGYDLDALARSVQAHLRVLVDLQAAEFGGAF